MLRSLLTYPLLAILLVSRIGVPVYSHVCHEMAESWRSFYLPANACCSWTFQQTGHGCCKAPEEPIGVQVEAKPCCENRTDFLAVNSAFTLLTQGQNKSQPVQDAPVDFMHLQWLGEKSSTGIHPGSHCRTHGPPASLYGRSLLISQQVFRC